MNEWFLSGITILLFYITPILGLSIVVREIISSRVRGKELDSISDGLRARFNILSSMDISGFDASLSNWLETEIKTPTTDWLRSSLRLFTQAKLIGLGEGHRELLIKDKYYREQVINCGQLLTESFENGNRDEVIFQIANLYSIFLCKECDESSIEEMTPSEVDRIVIEALNQSAIRIQDGYLDADKYITNAMKTITGCCNPVKTGIPILLLQWASLRISHKHSKQQKSYSFFTNTSQDLSRQFTDVAKNYRNKNITGVIDVISRSF